MRAVQYTHTGGPEVMKLVDLPAPALTRGYVLVAVHATSCNGLDTKVRQGVFMLPILQRLPKCPGSDIAGVVKEVSPGSQFKPGDRVFAMLERGFSWVKSGCFAELVAAPEGSLALIPSGVSFEQAAAAPTVALTFLQALPLDRIKPGQRVLIHAGSGGVGHVGIQLAKSRGAYVITTASLSNKLFCKRMGAAEVIDYREADFLQVLKSSPVDSAVETVGGDYSAKTAAITKKSGYVAHVFSQGWSRLGYGPVLAFLLEIRDVLLGILRALLGWGPSYWPIGLHTDQKLLQTVAGLMASGKLDVHVDKVFPLAETAQAFQYYEGSSVQGKVVVKVQ